eukprot:2497485-Amphidinium_carterae.1
MPQKTVVDPPPFCGGGLLLGCCWKDNLGPNSASATCSWAWQSCNFPNSTAYRHTRHQGKPLKRMKAAKRPTTRSHARFSMDTHRLHFSQSQQNATHHEQSG